MLNLETNRRNALRYVPMRSNRPFALTGHVTSFLWKWKLYDFAFEKRLTIKINVSYLELFYQTFFHGYWNYKVWNIFSFHLNSNIQNFYFSHLLNTSLSVGDLDRVKFGFYRFQSFFFIVVIVISILLKTAFWQTSVHNQSLVKKL